MVCSLNRLVLLFFPYRIVNESSYPELMPVTVVFRCDGIQKVNVSVPNFYSAAGFSGKFMKMVFIKVCSESDLMNMVTIPNWNCLSGNSSESVVMRIFFPFSNFNTALNFMHMTLRTATFIFIVNIIVRAWAVA